MTDEQLAQRIARLPKGSTKGRKHTRLNALSVAKLMAALMAERPGAKCVIQRARDYRARKLQARMLGLTSVRELPRASA